MRISSMFFLAGSDRAQALFLARFSLALSVTVLYTSRFTYHNERPYTATMQYIVLFWSLALSPGHLTISAPSVTVSQ
jgi:hypothetical protein